MSTDPVTRSNENCVSCVRVPSAGKEPRVIAERMSKALVILASCAVTLCIPLTPLTAVAADNELYLEYSGGATYVPYQRLIGANPAPESFAGCTLYTSDAADAPTRGPLFGSGDYTYITHLTY